MSNKKRLMVLGASYSQIPLFRAAKRLGYTTIAASIPGPYAGFPEADEIAYVDITDPEAVLAAAQELEIDGTATCCMDVGIQALGYVNEKLGLPGPGIRATQASCDKSIEKEAYVRGGVKTAAYRKIHNAQELEEALDELRFPVILKAVDLMGSRGIFRSDSKEEARANFARSMEATAKDFCIVEEFIEGKMFGVEAMMSCGKLAYCLPLGNDMKGGNPTFPIGHYVPAGFDEQMEEKIREQVLLVAQALGFDNCGMDLDCMLYEGEIYIIEATARAGATCITDTVGIYYGIDYFEAIARASMGEDVTGMFAGDQVPHRASVSLLLSADKEGTVKAIHVPETLPENVTDLSFNIEAGSEVQPMTNGRDRIGQLIVAGESVEACRKIQNEVLDGIRLEYMQGE